MNSFYNQDSGSGTKRGKAMNAAKMTLVSTVFVAALSLALGLMSAPAAAHCRDKHLDADGECFHDDSNQRSQTFDVEIETPLILPGGIITGEFCIGSSKRKQVTDAKFPPENGCKSITLNSDPPLHLCQVNINRPNRPDMSLTMYFTSVQGEVGGALCGDVYVGQFPAAFDDPDDCEVGNPCVVIINLSGLRVEKLQQPNKGDEAGGDTFSVGTIIWTPVP